jgi:hypothetical protein
MREMPLIRRAQWPAYTLRHPGGQCQPLLKKGVPLSSIVTPGALCTPFQSRVPMSANIEKRASELVDEVGFDRGPSS